jgi:hypothetical protein
MNINLRIERLILDGLPIAPAQSALVQAAVEAELGRLLTAGGLHAGLHSGIALPSLRANALQLNAGSNPTQIGQQIAQAVYGGIGQ